MGESKLSDQRSVWRSKPVLRAIYCDLYERIAERCKPGDTLEIGGGGGNFAESVSKCVVATDIQMEPWLDAVADAQRLPFRAASFDNIVLFDVLHHLERPIRFFREAARVLRPDGRIVMVEPAITPVSGLFYRHFHPEPFDLHADPLQDGPLSENRDPFDANQAIPTLLFRRGEDRLHATIESFRTEEVKLTSLIAYPLSGGFRSWSLIPASLVPAILWFDALLAPYLGRLTAFRMLVVVRKAA